MEQNGIALPRRDWKERVFRKTIGWRSSAWLREARLVDAVDSLCVFGDFRERLLLTDTAGDVVNLDQPGAGASIHVGEQRV